uniref:G-protein coupled receptors family 1 profile domain-containing protein n=1 Tax=Sinocyclocheilus anshuiensis TaxID=1608454 RepID=A0A671T693_9TELE
PVSALLSPARSRHYNHTGKLDQNRYRDGLKPESIACLFICFLIVVENSVILMAIWKNKKFHMPMYYLLGNLTLSDLLAGFTYMLNIVLSADLYRWSWGRWRVSEKL